MAFEAANVAFESDLPSRNYVPSGGREGYWPNSQGQTMSNNDDNTNFGLSRRKMLGGLGVIGIASAGAGLGTTAYFSDSESFTENEIAAGRFELDVLGMITHVDQGDYTEFSLISEGDEAEASATGFVQLDDVKPGDSFEVCFDPTVRYNPGYVCFNGEVDADADLTGPDNPEMDVSHVDLASEDFMTLGDALNAVLCWEDIDSGDTLPLYGDEDSSSEDALTLNELFELLNDDASGVHAYNQAAELCVGEPAANPDEMSATTRICLKLDLPIGYGNATQGATTGFDVTFHAEQCRHNDEPFNGMCLDPLGAGEEENGEEEITL